MQHSNTAASGPGLSGSTIAPHCMIIEDEAGIRSLISRALSGHGITVSEFGDVQTAISSLANDDPKVIFLDVSLADSDAIDAIRELAERKFSGAVQLISGQSAGTLAEIKKIGERHGLRMCSPIAKPFTADAIYRVIAQEESLAGPALSEHPVSLRDALRKGWFELWYQPKIDLRTMRLAGAEALVRARQPNGKMVPPGVFLPGASEQQMLALTERVILQALRDWEACAAHGVSVKFSVNVPVSALVKLPIPRILREERPRSKSWPGLVMEVTEDEIIHDLQIANEVAAALRTFNCTLALDDFGAGYSSLARLRQLPFSELKIDRSYVMNCNSDKLNAGLCETIVELGKRVGLKTVAEGIETWHECHKLQAVGCDIGQGYLFAKPMPLGQLIGMMRARLTAAPETVASQSAPGDFIPKFIR
jgi:EAL domain-containing protein (putative c-di-GMP-specific phosphodiesterase class I)